MKKFVYPFLHKVTSPTKIIDLVRKYNDLVDKIEKALQENIRKKARRDWPGG